MVAVATMVASVTAVAGAVLDAVPASAHATFVSPATAAVGTDVSFILDVPHERDESTYNEVVRIKVPDGWRGISCDPFPTWSCSVGGGEIDFSKDSGAPPAQDETFRFVAHADAGGRVTFPVVQIYSTGENVLWQDTAIVTAIGDSTTSTVAPIDPTSTTDPSMGGVSDDGAPADAGMTHEAGAGVAADDSGSGATDRAGLDGAASTDGSRESSDGSELAGGTAASGEGGQGTGTTVLIVVLIVAVGAVGAGAATTMIVLRRRRSGA